MQTRSSPFVGEYIIIRSNISILKDDSGLEHSRVRKILAKRRFSKAKWLESSVISVRFSIARLVFHIP
jgi:hypothetical protein